MQDFIISGKVVDKGKRYLRIVKTNKMNYNPLRPCNELPLLPPKENIETNAVLKKAVTAGRALAELKGYGRVIPNQAMLVNTIVLQEAQSSSEIEKYYHYDRCPV